LSLVQLLEVGGTKVKFVSTAEVDHVGVHPVFLSAQIARKGDDEGFTLCHNSS
jgi:hypothetical protein